MFPEDMPGLLLGLPHTIRSSDAVSNARDRLITVVDPEGSKTGARIGGSAGAALSGEKQTSRDLIEVNRLIGEGTTAADQAARHVMGMSAQTILLEAADSSGRQDSGSIQHRHPANAPKQKRQLDEPDLNGTEAATELSGPIQKRPRLKCDYWCAEPGCPITTKQINKMKEHMKSGHEGQKVILPRCWLDETRKWQYSERWDLQLNALMEKQRKGLTKAAFEVEKKQVEEQATRSPHHSNILTPDSGQPTPPGLSSWPVNSVGAHDQMAFPHGNPGLPQHAPEMKRRSSGDPRLSNQPSMHYGDGSYAYPGIGPAHAAYHRSPTQQDLMTTMITQYQNPTYSHNPYPQN